MASVSLHGALGHAVPGVSESLRGLSESHVWTIPAFVSKDDAGRFEDGADNGEVEKPRLALAILISGDSRGVADAYPRCQPEARPSEQLTRGPDLLRREGRTFVTFHNETIRRIVL
jgi:hypothetical protein